MNDAQVQLVIVNLKTAVKLGNTSIVLVFICTSVKTVGKHGIDFVKGWYALVTKKATGHKESGMKRKLSNETTPRVMTTARKKLADILHDRMNEGPHYIPLQWAISETDVILARLWIEGYKLVPLEKSDLQ